MSVPGFTAEASLSKTLRAYRFTPSPNVMSDGVVVAFYPDWLGNCIRGCVKQWSDCVYRCGDNFACVATCEQQYQGCYDDCYLSRQHVFYGW
jgi:hypothetical protein